MAEKCLNHVCPYCEEIVPGWPESPECCSEVHAYECGDEGRECQECEEKTKAYWAAYFGLRPGMSRAERRNQLEAFRPQTDSELADVMAEARKLK